ncbi:MAG: DUF1844 domain-containing protein [Phycisphaerae bacterium]|jgi:hypothetical protein
MSDEAGSGRIHIDSDWKAEAAREKERLAKQEEAERAKAAEAGVGGDAAGGVAPQFIELINLIAMQAAVGLGGFKGPGGETIPPNPVAAKHHIDLLEVLREKTEGNLTDDEKKTLDAVLYELRMHYVQASSVPPPPTEPKKEKP